MVGLKMLIHFNFNNFLSFKEETFFSLVSGERLRKFNSTNTFKKNGIRLLKNVILFGPNGSGKSNIIGALHMMKDIVLDSTKTINTMIDYAPFMLNRKTARIPTRFEIEIIANDIQYNYSFEYLSTHIISEKLEVIKGDNSKVYFQRNENDYSVKPRKTSEIANKTRKNVLFLYTLQDKNDEHAINVFSWFQNNLIFGDRESFEDKLYLLEDEKNKKVFLDLLKYADFNIKDIKIEQDVIQMDGKYKELMEKMMELIPSSSGVQPSFEESRVVRKLISYYKGYDENGDYEGDYPISFGLESAGTRKFMHIALSIIAAENQNKVLVFDEFDDSFHLGLSQALIKLFNSEYNFNQFILTSHELQHLDCELRKDQIYLLEKNYIGESTLFSLFDFDELESTSRTNKSKTRSDITYFRRYMKGHFGASPQIDLDKMIEVLARDRETRRIDSKEDI